MWSVGLIEKAMIFSSKMFSCGSLSDFWSRCCSFDLWLRNELKSQPVKELHTALRMMMPCTQIHAGKYLFCLITLCYLFFFFYFCCIRVNYMKLFIIFSDTQMIFLPPLLLCYWIFNSLTNFRIKNQQKSDGLTWILAVCCYIYHIFWN